MKAKLFLLLIFAIVIVKCLSEPVVQTKNGPVKGFVGRTHNKDISIFLGIPFAQPPVGALRFQPPKPTINWPGTYDATKPKPFCKQPRNPHSSEDCLYLAVWTPNTKGNRSVMVFIHGGGFIYGSGFEHTYDGFELSALGDIVIVNINYRLNVFGFFYDGTDQAPGNVGIRDMILALKWVRNNIKAFGGNPDDVTIVGHSAGAMGVGSLLLITDHGNLFKRAIMLSGTPNSFYGTRDKSKLLTYSKGLAVEHKCFNLAQKKIDTNCMRNANPQALADRAGDLQLELILFSPIYGDKLMPLKPAKALEVGRFRQNVDVIVGTTVDEFTQDMVEKYPLIMNPLFSLTEAKRTIEVIFTGTRFPFPKKVSEFYTRGLTNKDHDKLRKVVANSLNDYELVCPGVLYASSYQKFNKNNRAFLYAFNFTINRKWPGPKHGEDVPYLFGRPIQFPTRHQPKQIQLSRDIINSWIKFIKTGFPGKFGGVEWQQAINRNETRPSARHLSINPNGYRMEKGFYKKTCEEFWLPYLDGNNTVMAEGF